jgi:ubiquinone/menaquinone biosynthesis C-methylase UbiE
MHYPNVAENRRVAAGHPTLADVEGNLRAFMHELGIEGPTRRFVTHVSNTYHAIEAASYDERHSEIADSAPHWTRCLKLIEPHLPPTVRVLDTGSGTGFAAQQVLDAIGPRVVEIVCQDTSQEMLQRARARLGRYGCRSRFVVGDIDAVTNAEARFDLVTSNAVLHHLVDVAGFLRSVGRLVRPGGFYVAGHEPSASFYDGPIKRWTQWYRTWRRGRHLLSPFPYLRRLGVVETPENIEQLTNQSLICQGVIQRPMPPGAVARFVDIHVPPENEALLQGHRGFHPVSLIEHLPQFEPVYHTTYSHVREARARMGPVWRRIDTFLARRHPLAGATLLVAAKRAIATTQRRTH